MDYLRFGTNQISIGIQLEVELAVSRNQRQTLLHRICHPSRWQVHSTELCSRYKFLHRRLQDEKSRLIIADTNIGGEGHDIDNKILPGMARSNWLLPRSPPVFVICTTNC